MSNTEGNTPAPKRGGKGKWIAGVAAAVLLAGTAAGIAGHRGGHGFMGGWHHGGMDAERMVERIVGRASDRLEMTPEQEAEMTAIATTIAEEVRPLRMEMRETGQEIRALLLSADTVDRAALEALRAERLADFDRVSTIMLAAAADAAEVLTPEQRATAQEHMQKRWNKRGHRHD